MSFFPEGNGFDDYCWGLSQDAADWAEISAAYSQRGPSFVTCRRCGEGGLLWMETPDQWVLTKGGIRHQCSEEARLELAQEVMEDLT